VRIGLLTDAFEHKTLEETLTWCAENALDNVELGTGGYSSAPHADLGGLSSSEGARKDLLAKIAHHGLELGALNASGNPLHPNADISARHDADLRRTIELARDLGVERVVAMSGCPGGPGGGGWPVFAGGAWLPDMEGLWEWQWAECIAPYWSELSEWAKSTAPAVKICLELHPGTSIYSAESYHQLRSVTRDNVLVNLDPSHFWWQGMNPIDVIDALPGAIGWSHGKDTQIHPERVAVTGVLDFLWPRGPELMSWHFAAVGAGHNDDVWVDLVGALVRAGHEHTISIEHEDPNLTPEEGVLVSLGGLRRAVAGLAT
jgi:sugar phosphate isomerase/epimerase